jgi:glucokinase
MRILSADIGGTNTRFAVVSIESLSAISMGELFSFPTAQPGIRSFDDLLNHYRSNSPDSMADPEEYDALALAVAGAVDGRTASLTNIGWNIDPGQSMPLDKVFLSNDFFAQAHAFLQPSAFESLEEIRPCAARGEGSIAIVGAGTGLGHCLLHPSTDPAKVDTVIASESGHGGFPFSGDREIEIMRFMISKTGRPYLNNDDVVSGGGASLVHEYFSGKTVEPGIALAASDEASATVAMFARFYARACRNYCLATFPTKALIVSGGIAAKNPHILHSPAFIQEFDNARDYSPLLERVPIYLNDDQEAGIRGAAIHAFLQLSDRKDS